MRSTLLIMAYIAQAEDDLHATAAPSPSILPQMTSAAR